MKDQVELLPSPAQIVSHVPLPDIDVSAFVRKVLNQDAFDELVQSMRQDGQRVLVTLRPVGDRFEMVCGHRRLAAAKELGWETIWAEVAEMTDEEVVRAQIVENMKRHDLHVLDEARQFNVAVEQLGWSTPRLAVAVGRSASYVRERLKLLHLPPGLIEALERNVLSAGQAKLASSLQQLDGVLEHLLEQLAKATEPPSDSEIERYVADTFRNRTVPLSDETPFAWREECAKRGCLGKDPHGKPICTKPGNWLAVVAAVHREGMEKAVADFVTKKEKEGVSDLPVYYDLGGLKPLWGMEIKDVEGFATCPVTVSHNTYEGGEALVWEQHLPLVADKDGCRQCPAWKGKGPGRGLLVSPAKPSMYGYSADKGPAVTILCMDQPCRKKKQAEGRTAQEQREAAKEHELDALQPTLVTQAEEAAKKLKANRTLLLATLMVRRYGIRKPAELDYQYRATLDRLGVNLPPFGDRADAVIKALSALGEEALLQIHAARIIEGLDSATEYRGKWKPAILKATLVLLFGEKKD